MSCNLVAHRTRSRTSTATLCRTCNVSAHKLASPVKSPTKAAFDEYSVKIEPPTPDALRREGFTRIWRDMKVPLSDVDTPGLRVKVEFGVVRVREPPTFRQAAAYRRLAELTPFGWRKPKKY